MKYRSKLKVTEITREPFRYLVESHSGELEYLVDLTARVVDGRAHGQCHCTWFTTTANPNLERTGKWEPNATVLGNVKQQTTECKHIAAARNHYHSYVTMPMLAQLGQESPVTKTK